MSIEDTMEAIRLQHEEEEKNRPPNFVDENRVGKFWITDDVTRRFPEQAMIVLAKCMVVRAEWMYQARSIEYIAYSPDFDILPAGLVTPTYQAIFHQEWPEGAEAPTHYVTWQRSPW